MPRLVLVPLLLPHVPDEEPRDVAHLGRGHPAGQRALGDAHVLRVVAHGARDDLVKLVRERVVRPRARRDVPRLVVQLGRERAHGPTRARRVEEAVRRRDADGEGVVEDGRVHGEERGALLGPVGER